MEVQEIWGLGHCLDLFLHFADEGTESPKALIAKKVGPVSWD